MPVEVQVAVIWAVQNGYVDDVPVDRIKEFQADVDRLPDHAQGRLLAEIAREKALSDELTAELKAAADQFKQTWKPSTVIMRSPRDLRRRIRSISGTAQITKAMQMVAASKMRKAQQAALDRGAVRAPALSHPAQRDHPGRRFRASAPEVREVRSARGDPDRRRQGAVRRAQHQRVPPRRAVRSPATIFITAGRKAAQFVARTGRQLAAEFAYGDSPTFPERGRLRPSRATCS